MSETAPSMAIAPLDQKELAEARRSGTTLLEESKDLEIKTESDYLASGSLLDMSVRGQKKWFEFFDKPTRDAASVHKFLTGLRSTMLAPFKQAEEILKERRKDYRAEREKVRIAKEQADRAKAKLEADAHAVEEAAQLEAIGETEAAAVVIERAANAPPPPVIVPSDIPKEQGKSIRKVFKYRINNPDLIKREFIGPVKEKAFDPTEYPKIAAIISKLGFDAVAIVGGIEVYQEEMETVRSKG